MSLFGLDRVLGRMDAFLSLRKASITYPTASCHHKKNAQKQLKQNDKKLKLELLKKGVLNSKKICTLRLFSHVVAQHLLPGGGHDRALH